MTPEVLYLGRSDLITAVPKWIAAVCGLRIPLLLDVFSRSIPFLLVYVMLISVQVTLC